MSVDNNLFSVFRGANVVITGHTGFKGSWLTAWLIKLGANVTGIALEPPTTPNHFDDANLSQLINDIRIDIRNSKDLENAILGAKPHFLFHLAAQSLVRKSHDDPVGTWSTNVMGTLNVLEALRKLDDPLTAIIVTSDKCYDNVEWVWGYKETDALGGIDPYSASKGAAELVIKSHIKSFFLDDKSKVRIASARAGNVIGGGDWAIDRIIPDCIKAWSRNESAFLRNPGSTRPWQHVLEPLSGYLNLAVELSSNSLLNGQPFNFGPLMQQNHSVKDLVKNMAPYWKNVIWKEEIRDVTSPYESTLLKLNCDKALHFLNWSATMGFEDTVRMTAEWYCNYYQDESRALEITNTQILEYTNIAKSKRIPWAM